MEEGSVKFTGRYKTRGSGNAAAKLTEAHIHCIRAYDMLGLSMRNIANLYDIHFSSVYKIIHRKTWAWVK